MAALTLTPGRVALLEQIATGRVVSGGAAAEIAYLRYLAEVRRPERVTARVGELVEAGWAARPAAGSRRYRLTVAGVEVRRAHAPGPDLGAVRAAELLAGRFGVEVPPHALPELARRGFVPQVGYYKDWALYSGYSLDAFTDRQVLDAAIRDGELFTGDEAAARLRIRRVDLDHLVSAGLLTPADYVHSRHQRRRETPAVALYRAGALDDVLARADIDWDAVRATPAGGRSPLARLRSAVRGG